jgi:hypothetical protein
MSIALMSAAWKAELPTTRKIVLLALADNASDQGECYPSIPALAQQCGMSERSIYQCLRELESAGFVRRNTEAGVRTVYRIAQPNKWGTPEQSAPLNHMQETPENGSGVSVRSPLNVVQGTPERGAGVLARARGIDSLYINKDMYRKTNNLYIKDLKHQITSKANPPLPPPLPPSEPAGLDLAAWNRWVAYRAEIRKPIKPASIAAAQRAMVAHGPNQAAAVEQSIANGWQGLFALKAPSPARQPSSREQRIAAYYAQAAAYQGERDVTAEVKLLR